jgi:putative methyltransferase (TIGR04325 family)
MQMLSKLIKQVIPPIFWKLFAIVYHKKSQPIWSGNYLSWNEAKSHCSGYDDGVILEKCKNALLKVKKGEEVYERDSVIFDQIQYSWGLLAGLQKAAIQNENNLCVLDFGGSLGSSYYQNIKFLKPDINVVWCIVEQQNFVECGKQHFGSNELKFYYSVEECIKQHRPTVLLLSSVLQYLENPYDWIDKFSSLGIEYVIIDRTAFTLNETDILTVQNVPDTIYSASYPAWFFSRNKFLKSWSEYEILASFDSGYTPPILLNGLNNVFWDGLILKK